MLSKALFITKINIVNTNPKKNKVDKKDKVEVTKKITHFKITEYSKVCGKLYSSGEYLQ